MVTKGIKYVQIDVAQNIAFPLDEAAEMGGGSNVSDRAGWRVSVAFEIICERIDMWSLIPPRRRLNDLGAEKKFSNMGSPCWVLAIDGQHQRSKRPSLMVSHGPRPNRCQSPRSANPGCLTPH